MAVTKTTFGGMHAITLTQGEYEATLLPEKGGNLVSFRDHTRNFHFIREPLGDLAGFERSPIRFGFPILFPPNRYEDGRFTVDGQAYELPITEEATHNHIHGFFFRSAWPVVDMGEEQGVTYVEIRQDVDSNHPVYEFLPHLFSLSIRYELSSDGLAQHVRVTNRGETSMPCMIGFHTALNVPFAQESRREDCTFTATIGERWELSERKLPTGRRLPLNEGEQKIAAVGISPFFEPMDNHYSAVPQNGKNQMVLTDHRLNVQLVYDVGTNYRHWMIWNDGARGEFFCPEPQTNMVNAPNLTLPPEETGLIVLAAGESWMETSRMFVR